MTRGNRTGQSRNSPHSWGERWTKVYENALTDAKYLAIADKTGAPRLLIGATFTKLLLYTGTHHPDTGSFEGFDVRVWATWAETSVELIERVLEGLREFGLLAGNTIANWAKRQGKNSIAAAEKAVSGAALRKRRQRAREAEARKAAEARHAEDVYQDQSECAPPADPGPQAHDPDASDPSQASVTRGVTCHVTVTAEEESEAEESEEVLKNRDGCSGRSAPLGEPQPFENVVHLPDSAAMKAKKDGEVRKRKRRQKCVRYLKEHYQGEEYMRRFLGLLGCDPAHDDQWWFDEIDRERKAANWDDVRDRAAARKDAA